jgi:hypothetical protein
MEPAYPSNGFSVSVGLRSVTQRQRQTLVGSHLAHQRTKRPVVRVQRLGDAIALARRPSGLGAAHLNFF